MNLEELVLLVRKGRVVAADDEVSFLVPREEQMIAVAADERVLAARRRWRFRWRLGRPRCLLVRPCYKFNLVITVGPGHRQSAVRCEHRGSAAGKEAAGFKRFKVHDRFAHMIHRIRPSAPLLRSKMAAG